MVNYGDSFLVLGTSGGRDIRVRVPSVDMPDLQRGAQCAFDWTPSRAHVAAAPG